MEFVCPAGAPNVRLCRAQCFYSKLRKGLRHEENTTDSVNDTLRGGRGHFPDVHSADIGTKWSRTKKPMGWSRTATDGLQPISAGDSPSRFGVRDSQGPAGDRCHRS